MQIKVRLDSRLTQRWAKHFSKQKLIRAARMMGPTLVALIFAGIAHAQGTMDFSGAQTLMATFQTFPFPWPPGKEPQSDARVQAIADAARELVVKRDAWLNPPDATPADLSKRTLTNLYNKRPSWLADAHRKLDEAVFAAYGWRATLTDAEILERLLALNHQRAAQSNTVA